MIAELDTDHPVRVAVDGAPAATPAALADALVTPLEVRGRPVVRASTADFLRPSSLRLERGRHDADAFLDDWLDVGGLLRELLVPLGPDGSRRYLTALWDSAADRATRQPYDEAPERAVLLLDGAFLLQPALRWEFDLTVHLAVGDAALRRRTPPDEHWTLPAYSRYADEVDPAAVADVVIRVDDLDRPALVT